MGERLILSERDWDRIYRGVELLREKELRKSRHGERPAAYTTLLSKIVHMRNAVNEGQHEFL